MLNLPKGDNVNKSGIIHRMIIVFILINVLLIIVLTAMLHYKKRATYTCEIIGIDRYSKTIKVKTTTNEIITLDESFEYTDMSSFKMHNKIKTIIVTDWYSYLYPSAPRHTY